MSTSRGHTLIGLATTGSLVLTGLLVAGPANAQAPSTSAPNAAETQALNDFRAHLVADAETGDRESSVQLEKFDALSPSDRTQLSEYLAGESPISSVMPTPDATTSVKGNTVVETDGAAQWTSKSVSDQPAPGTTRATTYNVHSYADETFTLAGITISRTRVWADYVTGSGKVQKLKDYGCQLVSNYDPFSNISISKQSGILSGGQATYKCYVVVKRGVPTPWGQINTTTRSAYQYMRVAGPGVQAHGWT